MGEFGRKREKEGKGKGKQVLGDKGMLPVRYIDRWHRKLLSIASYFIGWKFWFFLTKRHNKNQPPVPRRSPVERGWITFINFPHRVGPPDPPDFHPRRVWCQLEKAKCKNQFWDCLIHIFYLSLGPVVKSEHSIPRRLCPLFADKFSNLDHSEEYFFVPHSLTFVATLLSVDPHLQKPISLEIVPDRYPHV